MVNRRPLTQHFMPSYIDKMAIVSWPQIAVTSLHPIYCHCQCLRHRAVITTISSKGRKWQHRSGWLGYIIVRAGELLFVVWLNAAGGSSATSTVSCWTGWSWTRDSAAATRTSSSGCCGTRRRRRLRDCASGRRLCGRWTSATATLATLFAYLSPRYSFWRTASGVLGGGIRGYTPYTNLRFFLDSVYSPQWS